MTATASAPPAADRALACDRYFVHAPVVRLAPGLWVAARARPRARPAGRRRAPAHHVFGSYARLGAAKDDIIAMAADDGQDVGAPGEWHVHHVVEGDVYADVHFEDVPYAWMYRHVLPCVLVHDREHNAYFHAVSRSAASRELHGVKAPGGGPPAERAERAWREFHRARNAGDEPALAALRDRVGERDTLYANLHHYDAALAAVGAAVFRRARARLDAPGR